MNALYHAQQLPLFNLYKFCPACNRNDKLLTDFNSDSSREDGRYPICKDCINKRRRELRQNPNLSKRPKILHSSRKGYRICLACGIEKCIQECAKGQNLCKNCQRDYNRTYHSDPKHIPHIQQQRHNHYITHKEEYRASGAKSYLKHRAKHCERNARRYAKKFGIPLNKISYDAILEHDGYICHICKGIVAPDVLQFDHVIPLSRGGPHTEDNVKVAHKICNLRKGNRLMEELNPSLWCA